MDEGGQMNTILLATDGSPSAENAAHAAIDLAKATGWRLHVVSVWWIPASAYGYAVTSYVPDATEIERAHGSTVLSTVLELARSSGVEATAELREGIAVDEICAAAEACRASLVVVGAHGWGPVKRLLFGSVSSGVLHHAPCPVMVVRVPFPVAE
jgi:nucleotide-binding universal stress UspA family protein